MMLVHQYSRRNPYFVWQVQCQTWINSVERELLEAKRTYDEQVWFEESLSENIYRGCRVISEPSATQELKSGSGMEDSKTRKQKVESLEWKSEQKVQILWKLKRDLDNKRLVERKLRSELSSCESAKQTLQSALEDAKLDPNGSESLVGGTFPLELKG
jgi:hypothetical protein